MTSPVSGDLLSAASLLVTVLSLLYGTWYSEIRDARNAAIPLHDREPVIRKVRSALYSRAVPLLASSALLAAALVPPSFDVLRDTWDAWSSPSGRYHYDAVQACFLGVLLTAIMLTALTAAATQNLVLLLRKLNSPP